MVGVNGKADLGEEKDDQADVANNPNAGNRAAVVIATCNNRFAMFIKT